MCRIGLGRNTPEANSVLVYRLGTWDDSDQIRVDSLFEREVSSGSFLFTDVSLLVLFLLTFFLSAFAIALFLSGAARFSHRITLPDPIYPAQDESWSTCRMYCKGEPAWNSN